MKNVAIQLEFDRIKQIVEGYCVTNLAKEKVKNITYENDYYTVIDLLEHLDEAIRAVYKLSSCPIENIYDIYESLDKAKKGGLLSLEELYHVACQVDGVIKIKGYYDNLMPFNGPHLEYLINSLYPCKTLKREIEKCVSPSFEIYDDASSRLKSIRREIKDKEIEIRKRLDSIIRSKASYLADSIITIRNDRLVIPVKASYKYNVEGIILDESDSKQTVYIEPKASVMLNAQIMSLRQEEQKEIEAIIRRLSSLVANDSELLETNLNYIIELDFLFAKARYAKDINAKVATIVQEKEITLIHARHPLIEKNKVVANDFCLGNNNKNLYLITGPNTGGKTVALKTVGLLVLMNQAGLALPCDGDVRLSIFNKFFVDIGDDQSLLESMSTFSSSMSNIINMVENVDDKSLIIIDEIGNGTDPKEGESLAMAILDYFYQKGAITLCSTHYSNLKTYAFENDYISCVSMKFDKEHMKPTYKLIMNSSSDSYAFEISKNLGLKDELIENAKNYMEKYSSLSEKMMKRINDEIIRLQGVEETLMQKEKEILIKNEEITKLKASLEKQNDLIKEKASIMVDELVSEKMIEIEKYMEDLKDPNLKLHQVIQAKAKLNKLKEDKDEQIEIKKDFNLNDEVLVKSINKKGVIRRKNGNEYSVNVMGMLISVKGKDLEHTTLEKTKNTLSISKKGGIKFVSTELNLIGMHVDEAMFALRKYIDDCLLTHMTSCRIIHGSGTGALRKAVHEYLDKDKHVKEYRLGGAYEGGLGATIVTFK